MTFTPGSGTSRLLLPAAAFALLTLVTSCSEPERPGAATPPAVASVPPSVSAPASADAISPGWTTIENRGVQVDVPADWVRADMNRCEFQFAQWTPPGADPCRLSTGLAFYGAATFDPAHGPEVQQYRGRWSGHVYSGSFAVYVVGADRDIVQDVLDSVRPRASAGA
ncbi:hypothetical protein Ait01nite_043290 [Actinoplanes italicus]|uniref:LppP/LprE lipoprotein n=1 Tax=Actinoplanes italicus TaxID=113567 RepID=A0A2T0KC39_9ACTN|nr:hypothetical protein [Actinoplanes italicus]PRX20808.1 hypothetical protein CLV67_10785 [Actinoplanes italicus]GIE31284.1 hypothetical protein Ait01nite_043290 [Actinoplanes italicus]